MLSARHAFLTFIGGLDIVFGMLLVLMGVNSLSAFVSGAVGTPMWAGIGIIMIGLGNLLVVATRPKKKSRGIGCINFCSLLLNLTGLVLSACVIGLYTLGTWAVISLPLTTVIFLPLTTATEDLVSLYSAVILMSVTIFLVSLMAMFMDCCSFALFGMGGGDYGPPARPRYYDGHYGPPPAHIYKQ